MARPLVSELNELLSYDKDSGELSWRVSRGGRVAGDLAGCKTDSCVNIGLKGRTTKAHRIAWAMHYGEWPDSSMQIDHIDRDPHNNSISNLRLATNQQNNFNKVASNVSHCKSTGKWRVRFTLDYKQICFGRFDKYEEAVSVANIERKKLFGDFAYGSA